MEHTRTDGSAGLGRIVASIAIAGGICLILGLVLGAAWVDMVEEYGPSSDPSCWGCDRALSGETISLHVACVLIAVLPAAIIGHSPSERRRLGLAVLVGTMAATALVGFALSTGIGGRLGFPEKDVSYGIVAALASSSVGAAFGYDAGSLIRQRREGRSPPAGQWTVLLMLGFVVAFIAVVVMLAIVDAMLFA
jgi:hypothetical protein